LQGPKPIVYRQTNLSVKNYQNGYKMKRIQWLGTSLNAVREFPDDARAMVGTELRQIQNGLMPSDFKPMTTVGAGVFEIRLRAGNQYRVIYVAKFSEAVYVLHAFVKKTQKTAAPDLELAHNRYNALLNTRKAGKQS
jgi:phage-related protein